MAKRSSAASLRMSSKSILGLQPGYDLRPYVRLSVTSDQNSEMLQADAALAGIFNDANLFRHCVHEWSYRNRRRNIVSCINYRQSRNRKTGRSDKLSANLQHAAKETIFAIKPVNDFVHQFAW